MPPRRSVPSDDVLTLADLSTWPTDGTWLAVLGHPVKHSVSPAMHNAALAEMSRRNSQFEAWRYVRFDVLPDELPVALNQFHARGFQGLNLTVPHKVVAFPCVHSVDTTARPIGAVNTLRWTTAGWEGFNTDGHGLAAGLREDLHGTLSGADVILLGAGGAARGAAVECLQQQCASLWIANRTAANRDALIASLRDIDTPSVVHGFDPQSPPPNMPSGAWVINATSAGLRDTDPMPMDLATLPKPAGVYDMIYNPPETRLLATARARGIPAANGLSMLIHQGARALELWTGAAVPVDEMRRAARSAMGR